MPTKTIWLILDHPWQLFLALPIAIGAPAGWRCNLLISRHKYWPQIDLDEYRQHFSEIHWFERQERVHSPAQARQFLRTARQMIGEIKKLPVEPTDVFITLSYYTYLENLVTTVWRRNKQIFLCRKDVYVSDKKTLGQIVLSPNYHLGKSGIFHYFFLEPLLRLKKRTLFYWISKGEQPHSMSYSRDLPKLYDRVLFLVPIFQPQLASDEVYYPYPVLQQSKTKSADRQRLVFFLSDYIQSPNYYENTSMILQNLRRLYENQYQLEIRLHPNNPTEHEQMDTTGWTINRESGNAEAFLARHANQIALAASNTSSSLIFSLNLGIPTYSYHRCFGFDPSYVQYYEEFYRGAPEALFMKGLDQKPEPYPTAPEESLHRAQQSLEKIYAELH